MSLSPQRAANLAENPHAGQGAVVLDIGDGRGAIIAHLTAADEGAEVEIEALDGGDLSELAHGHSHSHSHDDDHPHGDDHAHDHPHHAHHPHVAVVGRPTPSGEVVFSAVFPSVPVGRYRLHEPDSARSHDVTVTEASVTEIVFDEPATRP